jgi:D-sedoheptulose 7-phosphate isomerase
MMEDDSKLYLKELISCLEAFPYENLRRFSEIVYDAYRARRTVFIFGNGGSAATACHMAADLFKNTASGGQPGIRAISLTDNLGLLTAIANDVAYAQVFVEQLRPLLSAGDVVIAISASGDSENVVRGVMYARTQGAVSLGLIGFSGGRLKDMVDEYIWVPSNKYEQVEDIHLVVSHMLTCALRESIRASAGHVSVPER